MHYVPEPPQGEGRPGSCWTSSIAAARPDAWRCSAENAIFDPCFTTSDPQLVSCEPDPVHQDPGVLLTLTEPLPTPETTSTSTSPWAWMVELADGSICTPFTGTRGMVAGKMTTYGCQDANQQPGVTILDDLIPGTVWQAEIADHEQVRTVTVKTVWQ
ncbi:MAG: hypothetical protein HGA45_24885 [Chloroflexales bacterium]|nr:hypothetical protein [Chloroflexales bacterium]